MEIPYLLFLMLLLLATLVACFFSVSLIIGLIMAKGVPFVSSPAYDLQNICRAAELRPGEVIYDLGCGKANLLTVASKEFGAKGVGYEISLWPYFWGRLRIWLSGADVKLHLKNFFKADLKSADVVFCYLFPEIMAKLEPKFKAELRPGARVVSYSFKLPTTTPEKIIDGERPVGFIDKNLRTTGKIHIYKF